MYLHVSILDKIHCVCVRAHAPVCVYEFILSLVSSRYPAQQHTKQHLLVIVKQIPVLVLKAVTEDLVVDLLLEYQHMLEGVHGTVGSHHEISDWR